MPLDVLGHLIHQVQLHCPKELGVMMGDVSLHRFEELFLAAAGELRPALAIGDPSMPFSDCGYSGPHYAVWLCVARPSENVVRCDPGLHGEEDAVPALAIRFQNVAAGRTRH